MHVLKPVNKRKRSSCIPLLNDSAWIRSDRWCHFLGGVPRPVVHAPIPWLHPHVKTVPQRNVKRKTYRKLKLDWNMSQNKSNVANKLVGMENMYFKIIYFARFHLYFAILYFCLQKAHLFFSILSFSFAKLCYVVYIYVVVTGHTGIQERGDEDWHKQ